MSYPGVDEPRITGLPPRQYPYRLTGNYGTFEIRRTVYADSALDAYDQGGIMTTLVAAGWSIVSSPDGEEWTIEAWDEAAHDWVELDDWNEEEDESPTDT